LRRCQAVVLFGTSPQSRATWSILRFRASTKAVLRDRYSLEASRSFGSAGVPKCSKGIKNLTAQ
jgi:hypothetical protein